MPKFEEKMCRSAAKTLISSLEFMQAENFETIELPDELLTTISKLNLTEQKSLVLRAQFFLNIGVNIPALKRQLSEIENNREERELEDTHLLHGAPLALMRRLFGMHASEFSRRRKILNIKGSGSGRPQQCDEDLEQAVWKCWGKRKNVDERHRFLEVAEETGLDLHLIWSTLKHYIDT